MSEKLRDKIASLLQRVTNKTSTAPALPSERHSGALDLPLSLVLDDVSHRLAAYESVALLPLVPVAAA